MATRHRPGILCLEGAWDPKLTSTSTVAPILELLRSQQAIEYAHKDVATPTELNHYLNKWLQKQYANLDVGYLAFHGEPGVIFLGRKRVTLDDIAGMLDGRGRGRILHFGSCSTLDVPLAEIREFLSVTKLRAICGYRSDVDWIESAAFEVLLIDSLSHYKRVDAAYNWMKKNYPGMCRRLKFKMVW